jgi:uncharacterized circularly permuted ATP-grasp superfamily protein
MQLSREELDEMLRWADEVRRKLRRATRELAQLGDEIFRARARATDHDIQGRAAIVLA